MTEPAAKLSWRTELPLLFAIFLDLVGFGMIIPDIQTRAERLGAAGPVIGLLLASYFVVQILVSPKWGILSDRIGRKPVLVGCGLLSALSMVAYGLATTLWWILAARILAGLAAANVAVAQAYIADKTTLDERTAAMGRVGAAITTGLILGPALGGQLAKFGGNQAVGFVAAGFSLLGAVWIAMAVPHVAPTAERKPGKGPVIDFRLLKDVREVRPLIILAIAAFFALACLEGTFGRLIKQNLGLGEDAFGWIFSYESVLGVVVQAALLPWIVRQLQPTATLRTGFVLQGVGLALTPFAPNLAALFGCSTLYAVGVGLANPTINSLGSALTPENRQGELFGLLQAARSGGFIIGPILGGAMFDWMPAAPYLLAGAVSVVVAFATPKFQSS
ncbi:MAG: Tetracycline resistance protein, class C [Fimbriimonadaceae bacterium]|nr:Tetracycline resistance protein, class C [Fimbriimonadaceae bacterium]